MESSGFANQVVPSQQLPSFPQERFEPLDPRYLFIRYSLDLLFAGIVVSVAAVVTVINPEPFPRWLPAAVASGLLVLLALIAFLQRLEVRHLGYLIRDHDLSFRQGVISRSVTTVPFARVQNVSIERGPLERWQSLASLQVRTAGGGLGAGLTIAGLDIETAQRLRALVVDRAALLAEEEATEGEVKEEASLQSAGPHQPPSFPPPPAAPTPDWPALPPEPAAAPRPDQPALPPEPTSPPPLAPETSPQPPAAPPRPYPSTPAEVEEWQRPERGNWTPS